MAASKTPPGNIEAVEIDVSCPLEHDAPLRKYTRWGLKAGFWFFFIKGLAWLAVATSAVVFGLR